MMVTVPDVSNVFFPMTQERQQLVHIQKNSRLEMPLMRILKVSFMIQHFILIIAIVHREEE
jgi:hypothetical protein